MIIEQIETKRLVIRNFTSDDANDLYDILGDAETMKYCEPAYDFEKTKDFLICVVLVHRLMFFQII